MPKKKLVRKKKPQKRRTKKTAPVKLKAVKKERTELRRNEKAALLDWLDGIPLRIISMRRKIPECRLYNLPRTKLGKAFCDEHRKVLNEDWLIKQTALRSLALERLREKLETSVKITTTERKGKKTIKTEQFFPPSQELLALALKNPISENEASAPAEQEKEDKALKWLEGQAHVQKLIADELKQRDK